jgi:DNA-directed RNA polymerase III subunit RPC6
MWTKQIQVRSGIHQNTIDKIYKALEGRNLIKPMKSVSHPQRKMWILAGLVPSEDATGGSWFSEGVLDQGLIVGISDVIEAYVSSKSWQEDLLEEEGDSGSGQKRKRPSGDLEEDGNNRVKFTKLGDVPNKSKSLRHHSSAKHYVPLKPGSSSYPTLHDITRYIIDSKVTASPLPSNAIAQLLQVMVYDDRLFKISRPAGAMEEADDFEKNTIIMYRSFKTPHDLAESRSLAKRMSSTDTKVREAAERHEEIEALGLGGTSEVPCMKCPVSEICGDGGPVNATTCVYFNEWYERIADADEERAAKEKKIRERDKGKAKEKEPLAFNVDNKPSIEIEVEELEPS